MLFVVGTGELAALLDTNRFGTVNLESALDHVSGVFLEHVSGSATAPFSAWIGIRYKRSGRISGVSDHAQIEQYLAIISQTTTYTTFFLGIIALVRISSDYGDFSIQIIGRYPNDLSLS